MIRTQVFLPEDTYQNIKIRAKRERKPSAQVIREALEKGLERQTKHEEDDVWTKLLQLKVKGPKDLSKNIDKYLYEE